MTYRSFITYFIRLLAAVAGLFLATASVAVAKDHIISRAVLEDKSGALTIAQVTDQQFSPVGTLLSKGYSDSAYWLRLQLSAPKKGSEIVLHISPNLLDDVRLYEPGKQNPKEWITRVTGDHYAYEDRDRKDIALGFVVNVTSAGQTFYLRIKTTSPSQITVQGLEPQQATQKVENINLLRNVFIGLMLWALIWAIDHYIVSREPTIGLFILYQGFYILYGLSTAGNLASFMPYGFPQLADWLNNFLACSLPFIFLLFSRSLLRPYAPSGFQGFTVLLLAFPVQLAAMVFGYTLFALSIGGLLSLVAAWYCVALTFTAQQEHIPTRRTLQVVYIVLALLASLFSLADFGWINFIGISSKSVEALILAGVVSSGLFCTLLYMRLRQSRQDALQSIINLQLSQQALELERIHKNKAQIDANTDYLTGLFNRRYFVERTEKALLHAVRQQTSLSLLMIDIDHFKEVNDTYGHNAGDIVLQHVAQLIRDTLREKDILGRIGGEEFAAALVDANKAYGLEIAQRIRTTIANTMIILGNDQSIQVTLSVGIAQLNQHNVSLDDLLKKADKALYLAKDSGRNRVMMTD